MEKNVKRISLVLAAALLVPLLNGCTAYVRPGPPPLRAEVLGAPPYPGAIWIRGHWAWRPRLGNYVWVPGHWRPAY